MLLYSIVFVARSLIPTGFNIDLILILILNTDVLNVLISIFGVYKTIIFYTHVTSTMVLVGIIHKMIDLIFLIVLLFNTTVFNIAI